MLLIRGRRSRRRRRRRRENIKITAPIETEDGRVEDKANLLATNFSETQPMRIHPKITLKLVACRSIPSRWHIPQVYRGFPLFPIDM
ncbi:unnamed protein product, partial [Nesidiocoris tenuis]